MKNELLSSHQLFLIGGEQFKMQAGANPAMLNF